MSLQASKKPEKSFDREYELIENKAKIKSILDRICKNHSLLTITFSDSQEIFSSVFLEVLIDDDRMHIDKLYPDRGHELLLASKSINVLASQEGIDISFKAKLQHVDTLSGSPFYSFQLPEKLRYYQSRSNYRVQVIRSMTIPVFMTPKKGETFRGELHNVSAGGIRAHFFRGIPDSLEKGNIIPQCEFSLPDEDTIICGLELRHVIKGERKSQNFIGGRFKNLNKLQQRAIERFVASLERELRRRS